MSTNLSQLQDSLFKAVAATADVPVGTVKFGVDNVDEIVRAPWPTEFHVLDSVDFITYDQVLKAFTDEETFFKLTCVQQITGENQRYTGEVTFDDADGTAFGILITLPGIIDVGEAFSLYTEVQKAGHYMAPVKRFGHGGSSFTLFKLLPKEQ
ncbi:hypothetical protein D3C87_957600 [compost metagenome]